MNSSKTRRQIAWEAARLMYQRRESEYYQAKMKAARIVCKGWVKPKDLPSNVEIRDELQSLARMHEGDERTTNLREMRLEALGMMRRLERFKPRLIGSVLTGHVRQGSDIDLHVFSDSVEAVTTSLENDGCVFHVEHKRVRKKDVERLFTHIHINDRFTFELTMYSPREVRNVPKSSITGKAMERASIAELELLLTREYADLDIENELETMADQVDRFQVYESLLLPLEHVKQSPKFHPEGDALYHSLQVFDLARCELAYDEEFLLAALLHDVGKGIDPDDHVNAGLEALDGYITERTKWMIEHHMLAHDVAERRIGVRALRRLQENESFEELMLLNKCDRAGRKRGIMTSTLDEVLAHVRELSETFDS